MEKAGMTFEKVLADENAALCDAFEIRQAPTLVVVRGGEVVAKAVNLSNIKKYVEDNA
jgi:hypothetical protein